MAEEPNTKEIVRAINGRKKDVVKFSVQEVIDLLTKAHEKIKDKAGKEEIEKILKKFSDRNKRWIESGLPDFIIPEQRGEPVPEPTPERQKPARKARRKDTIRKATEEIKDIRKIQEEIIKLLKKMIAELDKINKKPKTDAEKKKLNENFERVQKDIARKIDSIRRQLEKYEEQQELYKRYGTLIKAIVESTTIIDCKKVIIQYVRYFELKETRNAVLMLVSRTLTTIRDELQQEVAERKEDLARDSLGLANSSIPELRELSLTVERVLRKMITREDIVAAFDGARSKIKDPEKQKHVTHLKNRSLAVYIGERYLMVVAELMIQGINPRTLRNLDEVKKDISLIDGRAGNAKTIREDAEEIHASLVQYVRESTEYLK